MLVSLLAIALHAAAQEPALAVAELPNAAQTTIAGTFVVRPLGNSSYAVTDTLEARSNVLALLNGPNVGAKVSLAHSDSLHVAATAHLQGGWDLHTWAASARLGSTFSSAGGNHLSLVLSPAIGRYRTLTTLSDGTVTPTYFGQAAMGFTVDDTVALTERSAVRLWVYTDAVPLAQGVLFLTAGANWAHAFGPYFHASVGVGALVGTGSGNAIESFRDALVQAEVTMPDTPVLPYPDLRLWWTF